MSTHKDAWHILYINNNDEEAYRLTSSMLAQVQERKIHLDWAGTFEAGRARLAGATQGDEPVTAYDAVLVDYDLGSQNGIEIIQEFSPRYPAPFILYTEQDSPTADQAAQQAGASLYVSPSEATPRLLERLIRYAIERKLAEQALRSTEEKFHSAFDHAAIGFAMTLPDGRFMDANAAYCQLTGYTIEELRAFAFDQLIHPDDRAGNMYLVQQILAGANNGFVIENRYVRKDDQTVWVRKSVSLVLDAAGLPQHIIELVEDVTQRKQAENALERYAGELERSNQALREFASIASHDLQEPLRKVQAFGEMLEMRFGDRLGEEGKDYIARMTSAAARMSEMLRGLLAYSRVTIQGRPFVRVDLWEAAQTALADLEVRLAETGGRVDLGELPTILGDPVQIRQLFQNLISNALKYHRPGVPPYVRIFAQPDADAAAKNSIHFIVQDNGIGFEMKEAERIFQPFVRLHGRSVYEGTGMGLAICYKIVERHGGSIRVESIPGEGATFKIDLPNLIVV